MPQSLLEQLGMRLPKSPPRTTPRSLPGDIHLPQAGEAPRPQSTVSPTLAKIMDFLSDLGGGLADGEMALIEPPRYDRDGQPVPLSIPTGMGIMAGVLGGLPHGLGAAGRGMYSRLQRAVDAIPSKQVHPDKIRALGRGMASPEEIELTGLGSWLNAQGNKPVATADVQQYVRDNPMQFGEQVYGGKSTSAAEIEELTRLQQRLETGQHTPDELAQLDRLQEQLLNQETQYGQYTLPGGRDYQERVVSWEGPFQQEGVRREQERYRNLLSSVSPDDAEYIQRRLRGMEGLNNPYLPQQPNINNHAFPVDNAIGWTRSDIRDTPDGPFRFIDEFQSDVHQRGAKEGYKINPEQLAQLKQQLENVYGQWSDVNSQLRTMARPYTDYAGLTRMIRNAQADNDLPNALQRWQNAPMLRANPNAADLITQWADVDNQYLRAQEAIKSADVGVPDAPLKDNQWMDYLFKRELWDAAENDLAGVAWAPGKVHMDRWRGHGNPQLYDAVAPKRFDKIARGFGGRVEPVGRVGKGKYETLVDFGADPTVSAQIGDEIQSIMGIRLTPEMKKAILEKGFYALTPLLAATMGQQQ